MTQKLFDLHTHTKYSDGRSPVVDNVRAAEAGGLSVVAITDHLFGSRKADWVDNMFSEVRNLGRFPHEVYLDEIPRGSLEKVAGAFVKGNKVFEIMNLMAWWFPDVPIEKFTKDYVNLVKIFAREGLRFSLGSDAHSDCGVGNLVWAMRVVKEANIKNQLIDPGFFDNKRRL